LSRLFEGKGKEEVVSILEQRMALMEQQIESIEANVHRLVEMNEFHHELQSPATDQAQLPSGDDGE
jgi:septation ring formation regulator EzrA